MTIIYTAISVNCINNKISEYQQLGENIMEREKRRFTVNIRLGQNFLKGVSMGPCGEYWFLRKFLGRWGLGILFIILCIKIALPKNFLRIQYYVQNISQKNCPKITFLFSRYLFLGHWLQNKHIWEEILVKSSYRAWEGSFGFNHTPLKNFDQSY